MARISYSIVDRLAVHLSNLSATATCEVRVTSDRAAPLSNSGCGPSAQTCIVTSLTVTDVADPPVFEETSHA